MIPFRRICRGGCYPHLNHAKKTDNPIMFILALILLASGALLYFLGRRGSSTGSFPFCTRCNRNLYMLPPGTSRCPECGADIRADNAVSIGRRQPVRLPMTIGLVLSFAGLALLALATVLWWPTFDASPFKSASMLLTDLTNPARTPPTARELDRRLRQNTLAPADATRLTDLILKLQADPALRWNTHYGDVLQTAQSARNLSPDLWQRYLQQSLQVSARIRPKIRLGDSVPLEVTCRLKAGSQYAALIPATVTPQVTVTFLGESSPILLSDRELDSIPTPLVWNSLAIPTTARWLAANPGPQTLTLSASLTLTDPHAIKVTAAQKFTLPLEILPGGQSSVTAVPSPGGSAERTFLAAFHWRLRTDDDLYADTPPTIELVATRSLGSLFVSTPSLTAAFRVVLRQDGDEWPLARFMVQPDDAGTIPLTFPANSLAPAPHAGPADIVCIPDPSMAAGTIDVQQVWGGEVRQRIIVAGDSTTAPRP
jgi:hypothetical protein